MYTIEDTNFETEYKLEMIHMIIEEKFEYILPEVMKAHGVDMWIHLIERGIEDETMFEFGAMHGCVIFTDMGNGEIKKALFGHFVSEVPAMDLYDHIGSEWNENIAMYEHHVLNVGDEIREYIDDFDPKVIAVNYSEEFTLADTLTATNYKKLNEVLGNEHSEKIISSDKLINDYRAQRVHSEIILYARYAEIQRRAMEREFKKIIPGKTSRRDFANAVYSEMVKYGVVAGTVRPGYPGVRNSQVSEEIETRSKDYIFQKGDFLFLNWGFWDTDIHCATDYKRSAYLLNDGEIDLPEGTKKAWNNVMKIRDIVKSIIRSGITAEEAMNELVEEIEKIGIKHFPFLEGPGEKLEEVKTKNKEIPLFNMDFHTIGAVCSDHEFGTSIAPQRPNRKDWIIPINQFITFGYFLTQWVPEWNKWEIFSFKEDVVITPIGLEFLYPSGDDIILV